MKRTVPVVLIVVLFGVFSVFSTAFARSGKEFSLRASYFSPC